MLTSPWVAGLVAVELIDRSLMMAKKKTRAGIFQPALRVRVGRGWEFQTRTRPAGNPPRQTRGYAQPVIFPRQDIATGS